MEMTSKEQSSWLDKPISTILPKLNLETILVILVLLAAILTRFYQVDLRVMSHDEVNHVVPAWDFFQGRGYRYDPVTHGPLQFHLLALSFFMLGDNDFSARVPAALFSIATVAVALLAYRRYLGRNGAIIAGLLFLISPFMMFYGRYTRNEAFQGLWIVLMIYAALRYLEKGDRFAIFLMTSVVALEFTDKATSYIFVAQMMVFLAISFMWDITRRAWADTKLRDLFVILMLVALLMFGVAVGMGALRAEPGAAAADGQAAPADAAQPAPAQSRSAAELVLLGGAVLLGLGSIGVLIKGVGLKRIRAERTFDLLMLLGLLVLPMLSAFPVILVGWNPLDYSTDGILKTGVFMLVCFGASILLGLWWNWKLYLQVMAVFFSIFALFFTTLFTYGFGFFAGLVGALGYWVSQQGVQRGSQPLYYYALIQVPIYEYVAGLGTLLAVYFGFRYRRLYNLPGESPAQQENVMQGLAAPVFEDEIDVADSENEEAVAAPIQTGNPVPVLALLLYWSLTGLLAFSLAGEKMPWLTLQVAAPMLLSAGWSLGFLVDLIPWQKVANRNGAIGLLLVVLFVASMTGLMSSLTGAIPPFAGKTLEQLQVTSTFILALVASVASLIGLGRLLQDWAAINIFRLAGLVVFAGLTVLTARAAFLASFVNYDNATEYLVYAHAARGPKDVLAQIEEISKRTTGGKDIQIGYDNDALYPYWWYLRDYPNHRWFTDKPTRDLKDMPLLIAGEGNFGKMEPIVKDNFITYEYTRLWWPNQDYFGLTWDRLWYAVSNREMRSAIFKIWMYRDYTDYAKLTNNQTMKLENWQPSNKMRFYIRKDVVAKMWNYGTSPASTTALVESDPYQKQMIKLDPDVNFGSQGAEPGQLNAPRGIAVAPDGSLYVADSRNHRIQHFSAQGDLLHSWGRFGDLQTGDAPGGTFNEPWGIAVSQDGSVFVSDTWNHRIQKFTADGKFVKMWGGFGQAEKPDAFWGPRGLTIDSKNRLLVTDTGNKRIALFDLDGNFISQFGTPGMDPAQFDEPVGIVADKEGRLFVADTWNQRVQVFGLGIDDMPYVPVSQWEVSGWFGQSLDNKPFIATGPDESVFVTDPEGFRVLQFRMDGTFVRGWGDQGDNGAIFGQPSGIAVDAQGHVWVTDAGSNRIMRFTLPK
jgi:predicted membrane-bound mannosyltransferase/DNA-binding beta-propeller fold protein YncE